MQEENKKQNILKVQNRIAGSISLIGTMSIYISGINLHRESPKLSILIVTSVVSFISPKLLYETTSYILKRVTQKRMEKRRKVE